MPTVRKTHLEPSRIAPDTFLVHDHAGEGQGPVLVPLNSLVIRGAEPVVVDTGMPENREPGWPRRVRFRSVPDGENAPHHVLVHGNAEGQDDLLRYPRTSPGRVPLFHIDDSGDDLLARSSGPASSGPWTRTAGDISAESAHDGGARAWTV